MTAEINHCPFCGFPADSDSVRPFRALSTGKLDDHVVVYCTGCPAEIAISPADVPGVTMDYVVELWNRRA